MALATSRRKIQSLSTGLAQRVVLQLSRKGLATDGTAGLDQQSLADVEKGKEHDSVLTAVSIPRFLQLCAFGIARSIATSVRWASSLSVRV